ncbi:MAG: amidophosphoribosyltransferase [Bacteroidaceae bacterium]|nr:amidophosphoribosyltransferase [Prevotellaceae bacterium]MDD7658378.1 amidophosphoribosyltransferase [Prevotellaceae bacterium]MDY5599569.1 amidophosphoribosyltransferase [Bacteroidaceae bacterium]
MEQLKHECGVAMIRLLKPLEYYQEKYGTWMYGLNKLYLLMEKQHNRGQEGAGLASVKMEAAPGQEYMFRERALGSGAITEIFQNVQKQFANYSPEQLSDVSFVKENLPFAGDIYMGHLRYSTTGKSGLSYVHPFMRRNNWKAKNLCLCGNFNLTNTDDVFNEIVAKGHHPRIYSDTYVMLELMGHRLDRESERVYNIALDRKLEGLDITHFIEKNIDVRNVLHTSAPLFDGGYVICGFTGSGEMFSMRDPWGLRPAFWYRDEEVVVLASERPVIQTAFDLETDQIQELAPGQALTVRRNGEVSLTQIIQPGVKKACSFERIYFSRGSDRDIYKERKALGEQLTERIGEAVDGDIAHTVFSFIPNTAEVAFYGMLDGFKKKLNHQKAQELFELTQDHQPTIEEIKEVLRPYIRSEKVAIKDIKLRTFITEGNSRNDLAAHVYDITYGSLEPYVDNLVVIDDSIVRGTTLKESIIRILDRLHPRKIVLVSSSPQVRYPDYYGIDMSRMDEFIAFRAAIELLKERKQEHLIDDVYAKSKAQCELPANEMVNYVKEIYAPFADEEISEKMVEMLRPAEVTTPIEIVYQTLDGLHRACPAHLGDWYFSGDYPTPGGVKLLNLAFIDYYENIYSKK